MNISNENVADFNKGKSIRLTEENFIVEMFLDGDIDGEIIYSLYDKETFKEGISKPIAEGVETSNVNTYSVKVLNDILNNIVKDNEHLLNNDLSI